MITSTLVQHECHKMNNHKTSTMVCDPRPILLTPDQYMCGGEGRWIMSMNLLLEHLLHKVIFPFENRNAKAKKKEAEKGSREGRKEGKELN